MKRHIPMQIRVHPCGEIIVSAFSILANKNNCAYYIYDVRVKRNFTSDYDTQHAHYVCTVLLKHE